MTNEEAQIIIGNIPIKPEVLDDCYSIAEYQEAKAMAIKALGERWIPISEKLPDECMNCLITVKTDAYFCNPHYENYIAWFDGKDFAYEYKNKSIVAKISIIAWLPLPQPYTESEGDD